MIREYCENDFIEVTSIGKLIESNYKLILNNTSKCFVYVKEDKVIGFIIFNVLYDELEITDIAVSEAYQGLGIASEILSYIYNYAQKLNIKKIILECRMNVVHFYEKNNYIIYNIRKNYYTNPVEDAFLMQRKVV